MRELHDYTASMIIDYLVDQVSEDKGVSKKLARKLILNAISYNVVVAEIYSQIDFLLEDED